MVHDLSDAPTTALQELLEQVRSDEYEAEELDDEWRGLLAVRARLPACIAQCALQWPAGGDQSLAGLQCRRLGARLSNVFPQPFAHCLPPPAQELDARLAAAGKPALSSRERGVAIRSLIVATASQSADAALAKAIADVEVHRMTQRFLH